MGKHSDFRFSSFQEVDAWRILKFKWKTEKYFKSLYGFGVGDTVSKVELFVSLSISLNLKLAPVPYATPKWPIDSPQYKYQWKWRMIIAVNFPI